jgi:hypothetical protein
MPAMQVKRIRSTLQFFLDHPILKPASKAAILRREVD